MAVARAVTVGDLALQVDDVACQQASDLVGARGELGERAGGDQFGLSGDGELRFEPEQGPLGLEVGLPLLGDRVPSEAVGDVRCHR